MEQGISNHGQVGEALYLKFTIDKWNSHFREPQDVKDGDFYSPKEILNKFSVHSSIPVYIDNTTQGEYECVCEFGVEVY